MSTFEEAQSLFQQGEQVKLSNRQAAEEIFDRIIKEGEMYLKGQTMPDFKDW